MKRSLYILLAVVPMIVVAVTAVHADTIPNGFVPLAETKSGPLSQLYSTQSGDFSTFINALFKFALAVGAIGAVLRLAYAGYLYMGQADMWSHKGEAKAIIGDVTLGLLLLLGVWLILNQINPDILKLNGLRNIQQYPVQQTGGVPCGPNGCVQN